MTWPTLAKIVMTYLLVNAYYVGIHAISKEQYERMIGCYFRGKGPGDHQVYSMELNLELSCMTHVVKFRADRERTNIDDVEVRLQEVKKCDGKYSIHFFCGLKRFFALKLYEFSKAIRSNGKTLVVRVIEKNDRVVFHGDLTNMYP